MMKVSCSTFDPTVELVSKKLNLPLSPKTLIYKWVTSSFAGGNPKVDYDARHT